jgi:hypothetical protein
MCVRDDSSTAYGARGANSANRSCMKRRALQSSTETFSKL